jgi:ATP-binding cassette subfamily F protein 3
MPRLIYWIHTVVFSMNMRWPGGYIYETWIHQTLTGLGFSDEDARRPLNQLSGGQKTRALLARLLLSQPDLLLLDEPNNHLDIAALEWLEKHTKGFFRGCACHFT